LVADFKAKYRSFSLQATYYSYTQVYRNWVSVLVHLVSDVIVVSQL